MKTKSIKEHRDEVMTHLKYIKERVDANHKHLQHLNGRVRSTEVAISWIRGIGTAITFIISGILTWFKFGE